MLTSDSIPGKLTFTHAVAGTFQRDIALEVAQVPIDLTGCGIAFTISTGEYDNDIAILTLGNGLVAVDLVNGKFKINWASAGILLPNKTYFYRLVITFTDSTVRPYLQSIINTI